MAYKDLNSEQKIVAVHTLRINNDTGTVDRYTKDGWRSNVGAVSSAGYRTVSVKHRMVLVHRLVYENAYGPIPKGMDVDHINGKRTDNRAINLRLATRSQNMQNVSAAQANNKTGVRGVSWSAQKNKFRVTINTNKRQKHVGFFDSIDAAKAAYMQAAQTLHTHAPKGE